MRHSWHILGLILLITLSGCGRGISGQYIAKFTDGVWWLQLVRTDDGHLTGEMESAWIDADGKIQTANLAITGASNGSELSLTFKPTGLLSSGFVAAGTRDGARLILTGGFRDGMPTTVNFVRSDLAEYKKLTADLSVHSGKILANKAAAEAEQKRQEREKAVLAELTDTGQKMIQFTAVLEGALGRLLPVQARYETISDKMEQLLSRERGMAGNSSAAVARSQIVVNMNQGPLASDQLHLQVQSIERDFQSKSETMTTKVNTAVAACHRQYQIVPDDPSAPGGALWGAACRIVLDNETAYRDRHRDMAQKLVALEQAYRLEHVKQDQYLEAAQRLQ